MENIKSIYLFVSDKNTVHVIVTTTKMRSAITCGMQAVERVYNDITNASYIRLLRVLPRYLIINRTGNDYIYAIK